MPDDKYQLKLKEFQKKNKDFYKKFSLGVGKLKLDPKLKTEMKKIVAAQEKKTQAAAKKKAEGDKIDLFNFKQIFEKENNDMLRMLDKKQNDFLKKKPDPLFKPNENKADWGKLKFKLGPIKLYIKPEFKGEKLKIKEGGVSIDL